MFSNFCMLISNNFVCRESENYTNGSYRRRNVMYETLHPVGLGAPHGVGGYWLQQRCVDSFLASGNITHQILNGWTTT